MVTVLERVRKSLKQNKKGITLVEVLVTMAVAGVIVGMLGLFMTQGTRIFKRQTNIVDLTNESQIISGQLEQTLMEARAFVVKKDINGTYIYTGEVDESTGLWKNPTGVERTIIIADGSIYISNSYCEAAGDVNESNLISKYVDSFDITIAESSKEYVRDDAGAIVETKYINPIVVNIQYELTYEDTHKNSRMTIKLRNYISKCQI